MTNGFPLNIFRQLSKLSSTDAYPGHFTDGYIKLYNTRLGKGVYPEGLIKTWKAWDERHCKIQYHLKINRKHFTENCFPSHTLASDNDCPDFTEKQLYLIFEFDYGGKDAEAFVFKNARQAFFLVLQVYYKLKLYNL